MLRKPLFFLIILASVKAYTQSTFIPLNHSSEYFLERIEVKSGKISNEFHSNMKPVSRQSAAKYLQNLSSIEYYNLSSIDRKNIDFIKEDNRDYLVNDTIQDTHKPLLKYIFERKSDFLHISGKDYDIHASPILNLNIGENSAYNQLERRRPLTNTRGVEIRANLGGKLSFYTMMTDNNQIATNQQLNYLIQNHGFPYESFIKIIDEDTLRMKLDYFQSLAYFTFKPIKQLQLTFGHDKNFIGHGKRSLILSDFSAPYLQLRMDLRLGKFQYQNIFAQMTNKQIETPLYSQEIVEPKYFTFHHLNLNVTDYLNIGIFENVVFGNRQIGFDLNYLNPVIFYRFIEGYLGSPDNAMVGLDFRLNLFKSFSIYGQMMLDEYSKKDFKEDGWWARKYGIQAGFKYFDVLGVENLDFHYEFNRVRPYTYSHFTSYSNYVNYNLPVAHPLGANFHENIVSVKYQPFSKLFVDITAMLAVKGEDLDSLNYGGDVQKMNYHNRPSDFGVKLGQGYRNVIRYVNFRANYMLWHNIYAEAEYVRRSDRFTQSNSESLFLVGLRWNFPYRSYMY